MKLNELNANSAHKGYPCLPNDTLIETDFRNELSELEIENSMQEMSQHFSISYLSAEVIDIIFPIPDYRIILYKNVISRILEIIKNL